MLRGRGPLRVCPPHVSGVFLCRLVRRAIAEGSLDISGRYWRDEWWHEVLRLIAGMVGEKQAGELIAFLMSLDGRSHKLANLMLAAGCLSEVRNRRPIQQQDEALLKRFFEDAIGYDPPYYYEPIQEWNETGPDRKSTRLNSSHLVISYAVFCL